MATHSSIIVWRRKWQPTPVFLSGESHAQRSLVSYNLLLLLSRFSRVQLCATPWTVAHQGPQSMEFSMQEYWSGDPVISPGDLPHPGIKPGSPALQADSLLSEPPEKPRQG